MEEKEKQKLILAPKIIVITGAESTGKSTLTEQLAKHFNSPFLPEVAREYVENLDRQYTYDDVVNIAKLQIENLNNLKKLKVPYIFADTWLIITKVWFEVVFQKVPEWIETEIINTKVDLFLLCDTDLPWIPDQVRENGGENREKLQNIYIENLKKYSFEYQLVKGKNKDRFNMALKYISNLNKN